MVIKQPNEQGKNWNERNCSALEPASYAAIAMRENLPDRKCQRRYYGSLFAQDSQAKGKLAGPQSAFDVKPNSPERECSSHKIGVRQGALHKKDWVNSSGDSRGYGNA